MLDVSLQVVQILASDTLVAAALASKRVSHWPSARCSLTPAHGAGALLRTVAWQPALRSADWQAVAAGGVGMCQVKFAWLWSTRCHCVLHSLHGLTTQITACCLAQLMSQRCQSRSLEETRKKLLIYSAFAKQIVLMLDADWLI